MLSDTINQKEHLGKIKEEWLKLIKGYPVDKNIFG